MEKTLNVRISNKRDTSANWTQHDPVILNGEIILVDTAEGELRAKIGNGVKKYTQLPFNDEVLRSLINSVSERVTTLEGMQKVYIGSSAPTGDETIWIDTSMD